MFFVSVLKLFSSSWSFSFSLLVCIFVRPWKSLTMPQTRSKNSLASVSLAPLVQIPVPPRKKRTRSASPGAVGTARKCIRAGNVEEQVPAPDPVMVDSLDVAGSPPAWFAQAFGQLSEEIQDVKRERRGLRGMSWQPPSRTRSR